MTKAISDDYLIRLYSQPGSSGYTDQELADRLEVGRIAIWKRRTKLCKDMGFEFEETERGRYRLDSNTSFTHIKVSLKEALMLYLATRRLSRNTHLPKRPIQEALSKLAVAFSPHQPLMERLIRASKMLESPKCEASISEKSNAEEVDSDEDDKSEIILSELLRGWSERLKVHIEYHPLYSSTRTKHTISPYLIEPSPWSDSVYVFVESDNEKMEGIKPLRFERIKKASLSTEKFELRPDFDEESLFKHVWGIWSSEGEPEIVQLKFKNQAAIRRLRESNWHPDQCISKPDHQGHVIWQAPIAQWREMLPWIRGWGADVEVLEPEKLRHELTRETKRLMRVYGLEASAVDPTSADYHQQRANQLFRG